MEPSLEFLKQQIQKLAKREVEVEKLRSGKFICKFLDFNLSPLKLLADTEEEAYKKLLNHLKSKVPEPDPESPEIA